MRTQMNNRRRSGHKKNPSCTAFIQGVENLCRNSLFLIGFVATCLLSESVVAREAESFAKGSNIDCDIAVVGGSPSGVACAVRAAREGASVLLVNRHEHLGGMLSSGLGVWDTQYEGRRSPIYDELRMAFMECYRTTYGEQSPQYRDARPGKTGYTNGRFEPHVAEKIITQMVAREKNIRVLTGFVPTSVERDGPLLKSLVLQDRKSVV